MGMEQFRESIKNKEKERLKQLLIDKIKEHMREAHISTGMDVNFRDGFNVAYECVLLDIIPFVFDGETID